MKSATTKFILSLIVIILLGLFTLPQFTLNVGNRTFEYPELTPDLIGVESSLGNFRRSTGVFSVKRFESNINFENANLSTDYKRQSTRTLASSVAQRARFAGLLDVQVNGLNSDNNSLVQVDLPEHYTNPVSVVNTLTQKGEIRFESYGEVSSPIDITDKDIIGSVKTEYDTRYGNYLGFNFDGSKKDILDIAFGIGGQGGVITMLIDEVPAFYLLPTTPNDGSDPIVTKVKALPSLEVFPADKNQSQSLKIVASYFLQEPLSENMSLVSTEPKMILPYYAPNGGSMIATMIAISAVFVVLYMLYKNRVRSGVFFAILLGSYIAMSLSILKLFSAMISLGTIVGFTFTYCVTAVVVYYVLSANSDDFKPLLKKITTYSMFLTILSIFAYRFSNLNGNITDFVGTVLVFSLSMILLSTTVFKYVVNFYHLNPKFTLKRNEI